METVFFNISAAFMLLLLLIVSCYKKINPAALITAAVSTGYSIVFDITFGDRLGLYYYISPSKSTLYMVLSAILIYIPANSIYLAFSPESTRRLFVYTAVWIAGMLAFEYVSLLTGAIVFTGWSIFPWSFVTYLITYLWLNPLYRYLYRRLKAPRIA